MPGPLVRFAFEAAFLVVVAIGAGFAQLGAAAIVAVMAAAWVMVALVEKSASREASRRASTIRAAEAGLPDEVPAEPKPPPSHVNVLPRPEPVLAEPAILPDPLVLPPAPPPEPAAVAPEAPEPEPEPEPEADAEPEPAALPPLQIAPPLPPAPPEPPAPEPEPQKVVPLVPSGPRQWNLWELERVARDASGGDATRDEELAFMLMYLREFATPDGLLPIDFDPLVRETFGELVGADAR